MSTLDAAMTYVGWGWSVIPVQPGGKTPLLKWKEFTVRLPTPEELCTWFQNTDNNVAVVTGRVSRLYVLDCDSNDARRWVLTRCAETRMSQSANGGWHFWYRLTAPLMLPNRVNILNLRLDTRGENGYVLVEPSQLVNAGRYRWLNQDPFTDWNPSWLPPPTRTAERVDTIECSDDDRRRFRARLYVARIDSIAGQGGEKQLFRAAMALVSKFRLDTRIALDELRIWNAYKAKPIWSDQKLQHTIRQAMKYRRSV